MAKSIEHGAWSKGQRAKSMEHGAWSKGQRAKGNVRNVFLTALMLIKKLRLNDLEILKKENEFGK